MINGPMRLLLLLIVLLCLNTGQLHASDRVKFYVDGESCDLDFYRTELKFVDFVRDRSEADVHLLITDQNTGSGGTEFTLAFIGQKRFSGMADTLSLSVLESDTEDAVRAAQLRVIKLGLMRYVAHSETATNMEIVYNAESEQDSAESEQKDDPWNCWVFTISGSGYFNGEKSHDYYSLHGSLSARRVTEALKLGFSSYANKSRDEFDVGDYSIVSESTGRGMSSYAIFSLTDHWSAAVQFDTYMSTYSNRDLGLITTAGLEYNIFPYRMSTRRQLRLMYTLAHAYYDYTEETVYDETAENLFRHELSATLEIVQPWGSAEVEAEFGHYLHHVKYNRLSIYGEISISVVGGLSVDVYGDVSRVRDQLSLPKGEATYEEILLQRRQLETNYSYYVSIGLSYTFGSIYNNIVNPRFGD